MRHVLVVFVCVAVLAGSASAVTVFFTLADDTPVNDIWLLAGTSVDLKVKVDAAGETFNTVDLWLLEDESADITFSNQSVGAWASMFSSFQDDYLAGLTMTPQTGVVELATFTVTSMSGAYEFLGAAPPSTIGLDGVPLPFTVDRLDFNIPEPGTMLLLGLGALAVVRRRRR